MKCINCGLPLSPNSTPMVCPRCHATVLSGQQSALARPLQVLDNQGWVGREGQGGVQVPSAPWEQGQQSYYNQQGAPSQVQSPPAHPSSLWNTGPQPNQFSFLPVAQVPFPQPGQLWHSAPNPTPTPGAYKAIEPDNTNNNTFIAPPFPPPSSTTSPMRLRATPPSNLGFVVATFFVISGGLMLVLVYILALGLPLNNPTATFSVKPQPTRSIFPSPTTAQTPTVISSPTTTVTSAFPAQQYIDNPQMASAVNTNTAQPIQVATTFKVNQKIYVTFAIHPNGKSGAVCLYWYLNNRNVTQYPFAVTAAANAGYSFAVYGGRGNAYVEIYWASTISCSDKILAQRVNFTVTA